MIALDLLTALRAQHTTGPAIAAALGITKQAVSLIDKGGKMGEETATKAATLLGLDACIVLAQLRADYADSETTKAVWLEVVRRFGATYTPSAPGDDGAITEPIFIMSSCSSSIGDHLYHPSKMVLFPEFPAATLGLLVAWLRAVPKIEPESPRFGYYCRYWDVPGKIQRRTNSRDMPPEVLACTVTDADLSTALDSLTHCGLFPDLAHEPEQGDLFAAPTATPAKARPDSTPEKPPALATA